MSDVLDNFGFGIANCGFRELHEKNPKSQIANPK
jgi:hypothetical protein